MTPKWVLVKGSQRNRARCEECGGWFESTWRLFVRPAQWTKCLCVGCAERLAGKEE